MQKLIDPSGLDPIDEVTEDFVEVLLARGRAVGIPQKKLATELMIRGIELLVGCSRGQARELVILHFAKFDDDVQEHTTNS